MGDAGSIPKRHADVDPSGFPGRGSAAAGPSRIGDGPDDPLVQALRDIRDGVGRRIPGILSQLGSWDREKRRREGKEFYHSLTRQVFNRIPGVSAIAGLVVGGWVASTFTTSPFKATLARWGVIKGGRHVVSGTTHRFLSVVLPLLVAAATAYAVQKYMKKYRERKMAENIARISGLGDDVRALVNDKLAILDRARDAGLLSPEEYETKKANLYAVSSRTFSHQIKELLISKIG